MHAASLQISLMRQLCRGIGSQKIPVRQSQQYRQNLFLEILSEIFNHQSDIFQSKPRQQELNIDYIFIVKASCSIFSSVGGSRGTSDNNH